MYNSIVWLVLVLLLILTSTASASKTADLCDSRYPGLSSDGRSLTNYVGPLLAQSALAFYRLNARWPANFQEIRQAGIVQAPLYGFHMEEIDPDDKTSDFAGDAYYVLDPLSGRPAVRYLDPQGKLQSLLSGRDGTPRTYTELIGLGRASGLQIDSSIENRYVLQTYALMRSIRQGIATFQLLEGRLPRDWSELAASKLCGLDEHSINPMTGRPITGKAGPGEIIIEFVSGAEVGKETVVLVDGKPTITAMDPDASFVRLKLCGPDGKPYVSSLAP